jgi:hypothetical protein
MNRSAPIEEKAFAEVRSLLAAAAKMGNSSAIRRNELAGEFTNYPALIALGLSDPLKVFGWKTFDRHEQRYYSAEHVIDLARNGDADADEVLQVIVAELHARGRLAPDPLEEYVFDKAAGKIRRREGAPKKWDRDYLIARAVMVLVHAGYFATRNEATRNKAKGRESACSLVAREGRVLGLPLDEKTISGIWDKKREEINGLSVLKNSG